MDDDIRTPFGPPDSTDEDDKIWIETSPETFNHPTKLWTGYWKRFNTIAIPLQSASSYFTDALAAAREAETREELEALLAAKYKERVDELSRAVRAIGDGWRSNLSPHAQDAAFGAGNHPSLETFAELHCSGILAAEKDSKAVEAVPRPQTFYDDYDEDDDAGLSTEQEGVSPVYLWDERLEEGRDDFTWTRNIRKVGGDEPSVRSTPPRRLFRQQWSYQSVDGDSAVGGEDVGSEPTPEDTELPQSMGDGRYMDRADVGDETSAEYFDVEDETSAEYGYVEDEADAEYGYVGDEANAEYVDVEEETSAEDVGGAAYWRRPVSWVNTVGSQFQITYEHIGPRGRATSDREETDAAAAAAADTSLEDVAADTVGSHFELSFEYLGPSGHARDGEETGAAAARTGPEDVAASGSAASTQRSVGSGDDLPDANKKRRRPEDPADEDRDDGSAGPRPKRQVVSDGRLEGGPGMRL